MKPPQRARRARFTSQPATSPADTLRTKWTQEEKKKLLRTLKLNGPDDIALIRESIPSKTEDQITEYIRRMKMRSAIYMDAEMQKHVKAPIEMWLKMAEDLTMFDADYSYTLSQVFSIMGNLEPHDEPRTAKEQNWSAIYGYFSALLRFEQPPKLSAIDSAIVLDLLQGLANQLKVSDTSSQHRMMQSKYELLTSKIDINNLKDSYRKIRMALEEEDFPEVEDLAGRGKPAPADTKDAGVRSTSPHTSEPSTSAHATSTPGGATTATPPPNATSVTITPHLLKQLQQHSKMVANLPQPSQQQTQPPGGAAQLMVVPKDLLEKLLNKTVPQSMTLPPPAHSSTSANKNQTDSALRLTGVRAKLRRKLMSKRSLGSDMPVLMDLSLPHSSVPAQSPSAVAPGPNQRSVLYPVVTVSKDPPPSLMASTDRPQMPTAHPAHLRRSVSPGMGRTLASPVDPGTSHPSTSYSAEPQASALDMSSAPRSQSFKASGAGGGKIRPPHRTPGESTRAKKSRLHSINPFCIPVKHLKLKPRQHMSTLPAK